MPEGPCQGSWKESEGRLAGTHAICSYLWAYSTQSRTVGSPWPGTPAAGTRPPPAKPFCLLLEFRVTESLLTFNWHLSMPRVLVNRESTVFWTLDERVRTHEGTFSQPLNYPGQERPWFTVPVDLRPPGRGSPTSGMGDSNGNFHTFHYLKRDKCFESPVVKGSGDPKGFTALLFCCYSWTLPPWPWCCQGSLCKMTVKLCSWPQSEVHPSAPWWIEQLLHCWRHPRGRRRPRSWIPAGACPGQRSGYLGLGWPRWDFSVDNPPGIETWPGFPGPSRSHWNWWSHLEREWAH